MAYSSRLRPRSVAPGRLWAICAVLLTGAAIPILSLFNGPKRGHEGNPVPTMPVVATNQPPAEQPWQKSHEATALAIQLESVCSQAAHVWNKELNESPTDPQLAQYQQALARQQARITGVRVASRPNARLAAADGRWLVDPGQWFVPEDARQADGQQPVVAQPPINVPQPSVTPDRQVAPPTLVAPVVPDAAISQPLAQPPSRQPMPQDPAVVLPVQPGQPQLQQSLTIPPASIAPSTPASPFAPPPVPAVETQATPFPPERVNPPVGFAAPPAQMPSPHGAPTAATSAASETARKAGDDAHRELLARNCFPSAQECAKCHKKQYEEWAISSHAYAMVSPMFQKFEQKIRAVSQGTIGHFCYRCHAPVATTLRVGQEVPAWQLTQVEREGVTCIACHRVKHRYTKSNGERRVETGDIHAPVYGGIGGSGVAKAIADADNYKVKTSPDDKGPGQAIHREGRYFDHLGKAEYCTACHQVAVHPGIKLEVVWEQYRQSPARRKGITCQDCHMGRVPGIPSGYETCAIAEVGGKTVFEDRKHANHTFFGPGYSIAHPGVFPFHEKANRWKMEEWLQFDWRAGWGTDEFEDALADGLVQASFPKVWDNVDDRYDAREIVDDNFKAMERKTETRKQVMENGSHVDGPFFKAPPQRGRDLVLQYKVANTNEGHNLPTASLGAQPQLWANVVLIDPDGCRVWETGYTDHWGDLCDIHSQDVRRGIAPFDSQLFNLQTMFLITGATGTDREFYLPVNVDFDQLPFLRPGNIPTSVTNHPPFIRMESRSIAPLGVKNVKYRIPGRALAKPGTYRLSFRMRSRTEPIYFMRFCDATVEMQRRMNEGILDVHPYSVEFVVE